MKAKDQIKNAIQWIDSLPSYKQAPMGEREMLGDKENGFCCLGAGCFELDIDYEPSDGLDDCFVEHVGLIEEAGKFCDGSAFYGVNCLASLNDKTTAGFKRIAKLMKSHPEWMFKSEVAKGIKSHYEVKS